MVIGIDKQTTPDANNGCNSCSHYKKVDYGYGCLCCVISKKQVSAITGKFVQDGFICHKQNKNLDCQYYSYGPTLIHTASTEIVEDVWIILSLIGMAILIGVLFYATYYG